MLVRMVTTFLLLIASTLYGVVTPISNDLPMESFLLKETGKGSIIAAKNESAPIAPASLTKIMTAILAIESGKLNAIVTIPEEATKVEPSKLGVKTGETFRLHDLVVAAMVESDNDAAMAIGLFLGGSNDNFAHMMNTKARALGMNNTTFSNPCGYDIGQHISTASDLAKLTEYAIKNPFFNEIVKIEKYNFSALNTGQTYAIDTHNKLLSRYKYAIGVKTGYTSKAGPCLIARAKYGSQDLLLIMLHTKGDRWKMASDIFDQTFGIAPTITPALPLITRAKQRETHPHTSQKSVQHPVLAKVAKPTPIASKNMGKPVKIAKVTTRAVIKNALSHLKKPALVAKNNVTLKKEKEKKRS